MNRIPQPPHSPIVFLDIDDVLCLNTPYTGSDALEALHGRHADPDAVLREVFAQQPRRVLDRVHRAMAGRLRYVISSAWREGFSREQLERVFEGAGIGFVARGLHERWNTPSHEPPVGRRAEIEDWLRRHHRGEPFVVLDDPYSGGSLLDLSDPLFADRVLLCPLGSGLCRGHLRFIVEALRRPCRGVS